MRHFSSVDITANWLLASNAKDFQDKVLKCHSECMVDAFFQNMKFLTDRGLLEFEENGFTLNRFPSSDEIRVTTYMKIKLKSEEYIKELEDKVKNLEDAVKSIKEVLK